MSDFLITLIIFLSFVIYIYKREIYIYLSLTQACKGPYNQDKVFSFSSVFPVAFLTAFNHGI